MSSVLTPISLRQSLNRPIHSLNVPIFATFPGIKSKPLYHSGHGGTTGKPLCALWCSFSSHVEPNCFQLRIVLDGMRAEFAAEAGALVAAKGQRRVHQTVSVDPYRAGFQSARDAVRFLHVTRPDRRSQAVGIVVRLLDDLVNVVEGQHG